MEIRIKCSFMQVFDANGIILCTLLKDYFGDSVIGYNTGKKTEDGYLPIVFTNETKMKVAEFKESIVGELSKLCYVKEVAAKYTPETPKKNSWWLLAAAGALVLWAFKK